MPTIVLTVAALVFGVGGCTKDNPPSDQTGMPTGSNAPIDSARASAVPSNTAGVPEDPSAILKGENLKVAFGQDFKLAQAEPLGGQGVVNRYQSADYAVTITEVKGEEAASSWKVAASKFDYPKAPQIADTAKLRPGVGFVVYRGNGIAGMYVELMFTSANKKQLAAGELEKLGKLTYSLMA